MEFRAGVSPSFSMKGQKVNVLGFAGYTVCVGTTHFCCCSMKSAIDHVQMNGNEYVLIKLYVWIWKSKLHMIFTS